MVEQPPVYRGRLAPSPTGHLHLGHARTFWIAQQRAQAAGGTLLLRNDDLDTARCKPEFTAAMIEDLRWFGFTWSEGPDVGGPHAPYAQSQRLPLYRDAFDRLRAAGWIYPCTCSRKDVQAATSLINDIIPSSPSRSSSNKESSYTPLKQAILDVTLPGQIYPITVIGERIVAHDPSFCSTTDPSDRNFRNLCTSVSWHLNRSPSHFHREARGLFRRL